jgi:hypothetical protein
MPLRDKSKLVERSADLPTDEVSVESQLAILRLIVKASDSGSRFITSEEVAALAATLDCDRDRVTRCIPFFKSAGLVEREGPRSPFKASPNAVEFTSADEVAGKAFLAKIFAKTWFGEKITTALEVAKHSDEEKLLGVLSRAGRIDFKKQKRLKNKTRKLIEYLLFVGYLAKNSEGRYTLAQLTL